MLHTIIIQLIFPQTGWEEPTATARKQTTGRPISKVITTRTARVVLLSVSLVSVCVCLSVNTITPKPLEISSQNFFRASYVSYHLMVERADKFDKKV